jgi:trans-2,3-dihydro-3-hydroxyanthranilate isomerase
MRIFTPGVEMPMAGHPTIGSTFALAHVGLIQPSTPQFVFGLNIGPIPVDLEWGGGELQFAWMTQRNPNFGPAVPDRQAVAAALGLTSEDLAELPLQRVSCGVEFLVVPLRDHDAVDRAVSDAAGFRRLRVDTGVDLAVYLFALSPAGSKQTAYTRMFAADFGIVEDPATGSAAGPLGSYLVQHGLLTGPDAQRMIFLQGVAMGRASHIHVAIEGTPDAITQVKVGGEAVLVGRGELLV